MAKIQNSTPFDSISKKFSKTDEIHFRNRKKDNATIGVRVKHPYDGGSSTKQLAARSAFAALQTQVATIMASDEQRAPYEVAYKKQRKFITLRGFIYHQLKIAA